MTPERWQQVKEIFHDALERQPQERAQFLDSACSGNTQLRAEVEALISSHEQSGQFIDAPAYEATAKTLIHDSAAYSPGTHLASYEIVSFISRGGMGEVYLAHDQRLSRKVALKVLPGVLTRDIDRLRRFEQEARSASALNHPNIITIYEIAKVGPTHVIATEFVEGETLRNVIAGSRLELSQALHIAIQIADALTAAHKAGIVHRDIKPENVMLRPDGYVKVLDFGLAKLVEHVPEPVAAEAPTRQVRTGAGVVMGTAGYMSPEQARGKDVDARSDIFSLGAVIYEMVSGKKPFDGETPSDTLAAILRLDPEPLEQLTPDAPPELVRIVDKSLRKDREVRYQVVKDLMLDLKSLKEDLEFESRLERSVAPDFRKDSARREQASTAVNPVVTAPITAEQTLENKIRSRRRLALGAVAVLIVLVAAGFGLYKWLWSNRAVPFEKIKATQLTTSRNIISTAISGDGKYVAYVASDRGQQSLWLRQVTAANDIQVIPPGPAQFWGITFTRDGSEIYYVSRERDNKSALYRMPFLGGTPTKLLKDVDSAVTFSPDGQRIAFLRGAFPTAPESALMIANANGTGERTLATRKLPSRFYPISFAGPSWSPDGNLIAASTATFTGTNDADVYVINVNDGKEQRLTPFSWAYVGRVEWLKDMSGLLMIAGEKRMVGSLGVGQIWHLSYPAGQARKITNDLNNEFRSLSLTHDSRQFVTGSLSDISNIWLISGADFTSAQQIVPVRSRGGLSWTTDGRIVYSTAVSSTQDIWIVDADGNNRKQLTAGNSINSNPSVSPDGRYIAFVSSRDSSTLDLWRMDIDGRNPIRLTNGLIAFSPTWSPDGHWLFFTSGAAARTTIWKISSEGGTPIQVTTVPSYRASISPDGKLIACFHATPETAGSSQPVFKLTLLSIDSGTPVKILDAVAGTTTLDIAGWTPDGKAVTYNVMKNNVSNIWRYPIDGSTPEQVTDFKELIINDYSWSRDGKSLACVRGLLIRDVILFSEAN